MHYSLRMGPLWPLPRTAGSAGSVVTPLYCCMLLLLFVDVCGRPRRYCDFVVVLYVVVCCVVVVVERKRR